MEVATAEVITEEVETVTGISHETTGNLAVATEVTEVAAAVPTEAKEVVDPGGKLARLPIPNSRCPKSGSKSLRIRKASLPIDPRHNRKIRNTRSLPVGVITAKRRPATRPAGRRNKQKFRKRQAQPPTQKVTPRPFLKRPFCRMSGAVWEARLPGNLF